MAKVRQRTWRVGGRRTKRKAWGFVTVENGGQIRCFKSEWTKEDAENALAARLLKIEQQPKAKAVGLTFGAAVERYIKTKARKRSLGFDRAHLNQFKGTFGEQTPLVEITSSRIAAWKADKLAAICPSTRRPYSAAAVNRPLATLRHLLQLVHEWGDLPAVPRIRLEREPEGRIRWLGQYAPDEEGRLIAACEKSKNRELSKIVTVALETGLRRGELLGLTWEQIDLSRGVIRLEGTARRDGTGTKSGRRREVPMRQAVYNVLAGLPGAREGQVFKTRSIRTAFENAVTEAAKLEDFHFHDCRHHFASWFVMRGGSLQALQKLLGHATLAMTMRYAHLAPDYIRSEVAKTERRPEPAAQITQEITHEITHEAVDVGRVSRK